MTSKQILMTGCVVVVIAGLFFFVSKRNMTSTTNDSSPVPQFEKEIVVDIANPSGKAKLELLSQKNQFVFAKGDEIALLVSVSSAGREVGGVDASLSYDSSVLDYQKFEPLMTDFDFYANTTKSGLVFTGVKKLTSTKKIVMQDTSLGILMFRAKKYGDTRLKLHAKTGATNDSNVNDVSGKDLLVQLRYPSLVIGRSYILGSGAKKIDDLRLLLRSTEIAPDNCFDCISSAKLEASYQDTKKDLIFESGGIAGVIPQPQQVGPFVIELGALEKDSATLHVFDYRL